MNYDPPIAKFVVNWNDSGREPVCAPDPNFPNGRQVDIGTRPACFLELPYPAPRCGLFIATCTECEITIGVTTAGRPDDPRSVMVPCKKLKDES